MKAVAIRAVARVPRIVIARPEHWRRRLIVIALLAAVLTAAYFFWLRDSSLVAVERVEVTGLATTPDAAQLRKELTETAKGMTTLHLDPAALEDIAARHPVVHSIALRPDFPHGLTIAITENRPVGLIEAGGKTVPVAADGTLLEGLETHASLPTIETVAIPGTRRVPGGGTHDRVAAAAAVPSAVRAEIETITIEPEHGLVAHLDDGPEVWLGDADRLRLKWAAATAILAKESSQGASYVDVRIPERAVAGGLPPIEHPEDALEEQAAVAPVTPVPDPAAVEPVTPETPATTAPAAPVEPQPSLEP